MGNNNTTSIVAKPKIIGRILLIIASLPAQVLIVYFLSSFYNAVVKRAPGFTLTTGIYFTFAFLILNILSILLLFKWKKMIVLGYMFYGLLVILSAYVIIIFAWTGLLDALFPQGY